MPIAETSNGYHHGDLRNAFISEGRKLLEEKGPGELSLREAARRVGVSEAAYSRHFEGREGLLAAIAARGFEELAQERLVVSASGASPLDKARQMMLRYVEFAQRNKGLFYLMVGPSILARGAYPELIRTSDISFRLFSDAVSDYARLHGWPKSSLNLIVHSAWAVEHGVAMLILGNRVPRSDRPVEIDEMIEFSISLLVSGITSGPKNLKAIASRAR